MPWQETCAIDERMRFVAELRKAMPLSTVCACHGISRQTAYKWLRRGRRRPPARTISPPADDVALHRDGAPGGPSGGAPSPFGLGAAQSAALSASPSPAPAVAGDQYGRRVNPTPRLVAAPTAAAPHIAGGGCRERGDDSQRCMARSHAPAGVELKTMRRLDAPPTSTTTSTTRRAPKPAEGERVGPAQDSLAIYAADAGSDSAGRRPLEVQRPHLPSTARLSASYAGTAIG